VRDTTEKTAAEPEPSFYAIIPASVRYDKKVNPNAKLLYGELTALTKKKGYSWASNAYFSSLYDVDKSTISRWIKSLADAGYIRIEYIYVNNTPQVDERRIYIAEASKPNPEPELPKNPPEDTPKSSPDPAADGLPLENPLDEGGIADLQGGYCKIARGVLQICQRDHYKLLIHLLIQKKLLLLTTRIILKRGMKPKKQQQNFL